MCKPSYIKDVYFCFFANAMRKPTWCIAEYISECSARVLQHNLQKKNELPRE
jgi:hypothetical protein